MAPKSHAEHSPGTVMTEPGEIALFYDRCIASVLGGVSHLRHAQFGGRRPYHFHDERQSRSGRWELWMDAGQALVVTDEFEAATSS